MGAVGRASGGAGLTAGLNHSGMGLGGHFSILGKDEEASFLETTLSFGAAEGGFGVGTGLRAGLPVLDDYVLTAKAGVGLVIDYVDGRSTFGLSTPLMVGVRLRMGDYYAAVEAGAVHISGNVLLHETASSSWLPNLSITFGAGR